MAQMAMGAHYCTGLALTTGEQKSLPSLVGRKRKRIGFIVMRMFPDVSYLSFAVPSMCSDILI